MIAALLSSLFWPIPLPPPQVRQTPTTAGVTRLSDARFGAVEVRVATTGSAGTVVLWLDGGGAAHALPEDGTTTIRVSAKEYVARTAPHHGRCFYPAADFEDLAQDVEKRIGWTRYRHPVVAGDGVGATLAVQALQSAPEGTFSGAIAAAFSPKIALPSNFCRGDGPRSTSDGKTVRIEAAKTLPAPLVLVQGTKDHTFSLADARAFARESQSEVVEAAGAGHDVAAAAPWRDSVSDALSRVLAKRAAASATPPPTAGASPTPGATAIVTATATPLAAATPARADVRDLPLHDVRPPTSATPDDRVQILLTGDGGWAGIDKGIASGFAGQGMRTVGWDSLAFFWRKKSPDDIARALARIIDSLPGGARVIASGFSFGADALPFAINRLPDAERARIAAVVLIAPSKEASFEIHPMDWLVDAKHRGDLATPPELAKLAMPVICVVPKDDKHTPCRDFPKFVIVDAKPGHHLGGDYAAVARSILVSLDATVPPSGHAPLDDHPLAVDTPAPPAPLLSATNGALAGAAAGAALARDAISN